MLREDVYAICAMFCLIFVLAFIGWGIWELIAWVA